MFGINNVKKMFIELLTGIVTVSNYTKCGSLRH